MRSMRSPAVFAVGALVTLALLVLLVLDLSTNQGGLLIPYLVGLLVAGAITLFFFLPVPQRVLAVPAREIGTVEASPNVAYFDYKGDVHDVIDIEGIGDTYAQRLQDIGVRTTARLCYEDAEALAARIGAPAKTVRSWQAMAELAKVNGIGKQYAEALVRGGVDGIEALKEGDPDVIAEQVTAYLGSLDSRVLGQSVTGKRVRNWQKAAAGMRRVRQRVPAE